jgi:hypothetical protein
MAAGAAAPACLPAMRLLFQLTLQGRCWGSTRHRARGCQQGKACLGCTLGCTRGRGWGLGAGGWGRNTTGAHTP